uniref:Uncharacterized protein n=1 Tax=Bracon brevicornis TaxID=1563983 RepID=A0A6V7LZI1_9HYME
MSRMRDRRKMLRAHPDPRREGRRQGATRNLQQYHQKEEKRGRNKNTQRSYSEETCSNWKLTKSRRTGREPSATHAAAKDLKTYSTEPSTSYTKWPHDHITSYYNGALG